MYLGVIFNYSDTFRKGQLELKERANGALYALIGRSRNYNLPVDIEIELYKSMVFPVLK